MLDRQPMNRANVVRSTFGFTDTKGKPNEFFSPVVTEKPTLYSALSQQVWHLAPTGGSLDSHRKKKNTQNQGLTGACSDPCNSQRPHPQGRTVAHWSSSLPPWKLEGTPCLADVTKFHFQFERQNTYPMVNPHFLPMGKTINK